MNKWFEIGFLIDIQMAGFVFEWIIQHTAALADDYFTLVCFINESWISQ